MQQVDGPEHTILLHDYEIHMEVPFQPPEAAKENRESGANPERYRRCERGGHT